MIENLLSWVYTQERLFNTMCPISNNIREEIEKYPNLNHEIGRFMLNVNNHDYGIPYLRKFLELKLHKLKVGNKFEHLYTLQHNPNYVLAYPITDESAKFKNPEGGVLMVRYDEHQIITEIKYEEPW